MNLFIRGPALRQTSLATYVKLFARRIIRYCAALENSSGEEETGSFLQGNALLPRGGSVFRTAWKVVAGARLLGPGRDGAAEAEESR